jgi:hypothetical protein
MNRFDEQVATVLKAFDSIRARAQHDDLSGGAPADEIVKFNTRAAAVIHRVVGKSSTYAVECERILTSSAWLGPKAEKLAGVLGSLLEDLRAGYLASARELIHGELFADFLEMSDHLLSEGYKDAAAVIAGSSLEAHLRRLAEKVGIPVEQHTAGTPRAKKADTLNSELGAAGAYTKLDQKNVVAWLDLRNKAAHGHYDQYDTSQVALLVGSIRNFIARNPA